MGHHARDPARHLSRQNVPRSHQSSSLDTKCSCHKVQLSVFVPNGKRTQIAIMIARLLRFIHKDTRAVVSSIPQSTSARNTRVYNIGHAVYPIVRLCKVRGGCQWSKFGGTNDFRSLVPYPRPLPTLMIMVQKIPSNNAFCVFLFCFNFLRHYL